MILYIQTAFLGDLLLSVPTLKKLRELYPQESIHLLCRKGLGGFIKGQGLVDEVFDQFSGTKPSYAEIKKTFSQKHYRLLVCAHQSFRSQWVSGLISADHKIGYKNLYNRMVFDTRLKRPMQWPEALRQLALLRGLDKLLDEKLRSLELASSPFSKIPDEFSMQIAKPQKVEGLPKVVLAPGSVWPTKRWTGFLPLTQALVQAGYQVQLIGSPAEKTLSEEIEKACPEVENWTGKTNLQQMFEILKKASVLVSNDSGAMHMASLIHLPTVSIFGPTVLSFGYQGWNPQCRTLENTNLKCRPCSTHGTQRCPIGTHECMTSIPVEQVMSAVKTYL